MTASTIQSSLERLQVVLHLEGDEHEKTWAAPRSFSGRTAGAVTAWLNLPVLVEIAVEHGVPRELVDVPRGVFRTKDGRVHWRSDTECSRGSTYQKLRLTDRRAQCPHCAHQNVEGRAGFQSQALLQRLAVLADLSKFLEMHEPRSLVELGVDLHELSRLVYDAGGPLDRAVERSPESTPQIEELTEHLYQRLGRLHERIVETYTKDEFREVYERELEKYHRSQEGVLEPLYGGATPEAGTASMLVVRTDGWQAWVMVALRSYPTLGKAAGWRDAVVLQVPGTVGAQLRTLFPRDVPDGPVRTPDDPAVLETALALYSPQDGASLSTLANAVRAAELV